MSDDGDAYEYTLHLQRGNGTDDRDKHKTKVTANTIGELREKVTEARELMAEVIEDTREIQPDDSERTLGEKQRSFDDVEAES